MHAREQCFSVFVNEANVRQIHQQRDFARWTRLPALIQFINAGARKFAFEKKPRDS